MSDSGASKASGMSSSAPGRVGGARVWQYRFLDAHLDTVRYPDGSVGEQVLIHHPGAAAVVPFLSDPRGDDPQVLLIHQYRYAVDGMLWEIPAGRLEPGEPTVACAHRELKEETGCTATAMESLTSIWTAPGFTNERIEIFLATGLVRGDSTREADEFIEVVTLPLSKALGMIASGEITDAKTVVGLLYSAGFRSGR